MLEEILYLILGVKKFENHRFITLLWLTLSCTSLDDVLIAVPHIQKIKYAHYDMLIMQCVKSHT